MKKSLIALAVAGAFVAPAAMADTTIFGSANVSFNVVNSGSGGATANQVSSNASDIGFKGSEDLGGGTSAIWQIDSNVNLQNSGATGAASAGGVALGGNDAFAGLSGKDWGTLILGQHDTPYKMATRGLDLFHDTAADNRNLTGPFDGTNLTHVPNVVAYMSPTMSGVAVNAAYIAGAENAASAPGGSTKGTAYSLAGTYTGGPVYAALAYQTVTYGSPGTGLLAGTPNDKVTAWTLAGSYNMEAITVNASYEKRTYDPNGGSSTDQNDWYLAGKYSFGNDAVKLAYTSAGDFSGTTNTGASQVAVGYDHSLSKNTTVYALYTQLSNKANAQYGIGGYDGITTNVGAYAPDSDPSVWSVGMSHSF